MKCLLHLNFLLIALIGFLLLPAPGEQNHATANPADFWSEATLYRDSWGVPHVFAENPQAQAFVFGYAQAEDHLEAMLLAYRTANGTVAAVLGEAYAESDAFSLKMGHAQLAREALPQADSITQALCEGFAMGVNAWIMDNPDQTPEWAEGVHPADILALWHAFLMSQAPFDLEGTYQRPRAMETSNAWALAPDRTREGKTLLVINPHQYHTGPFQWYEAHLILGDINIYGATLKGLPVIVQGHNQQLGWALSPNAPDTGDMFQEQFQSMTRSPNDPRRSLEVLPLEQAIALHYMSQAKSYFVRTAGGLEERFTPAYQGPRGPLFEGKGGDLHSWRVGGYYDFGGLRQLFDMGRAQNLEQFSQALNMGQLPTFHVVYADQPGNLFYLYNAKTGVRIPHLAEEGNNQDSEMPPGLRQASRQGVDWKEPLPAHFEEIAWGDYVPLAMLPRVQNPESGYIQATGNPPWTVTEDSGMDPRAWPGWLVNDRESYRAQRVRQMLRQGRRSFTDMQSMLYDKVVPAAVELGPMLLQMAEQRPDLLRSAHPDLPAGLDMLRDWDRNASTQSTGMTFYHVWWAMLKARTAKDFNSDAARYRALLHNSESAQEAALRSADDAARMMRNDFQTISIPWGDVHRIRRGNRNEAMPGSGTGEPIFIASDFAIDNNHWQTTYGYGMALAVEFGETPNAVSVVPFGASDNPQSPHYDDQLDLILEQRFKPTCFTPQAVRRHAAYGRGRRITLQGLGTESMVHLFAAQPIEAQLHTRQQAPEDLPDEMAAFSLFLRPERSPAQVPVDLNLEFQAPESVVDREHLSHLHIYRYTASMGWHLLTQQQLDPATGIFSARDSTPALYALLGPAEYLKMEQPDSEDITAPLPPLITLPGAEDTDDEATPDLDTDRESGVPLPPVESLPVYHPFPQDPPAMEAAPPLMPRDPNETILPWEDMGEDESEGEGEGEGEGEEPPEISTQDEAVNTHPQGYIKIQEDAESIPSQQQPDALPQDPRAMPPQQPQQQQQQQQQEQRGQQEQRPDQGSAPAPFPQMVQPPAPVAPSEDDASPEREDNNSSEEDLPSSTQVQRNFGPRQD